MRKNGSALSHNQTARNCGGPLSHGAVTARWLYFLANESTDVPEFLGSVAEDVLEKSPDAYRAIDIVAN